jgi:hypothetical protein
MKLVLSLMFFLTLPAVADELDLKLWGQLETMQHERDLAAAQALVPTQIKSVSSKEGLYQQVLDYHAQNSQGLAPVKAFNTTWGSDNSSADDGPKFEVKPLQTKASLDFQDTLKASVNYQVWSHQGELLLTPAGKVLGMTVAFSHVAVSGGDQRDRVVVKYEW